MNPNIPNRLPRQDDNSARVGHSTESKVDTAITQPNDALLGDKGSLSNQAANHPAPNETQFRQTLERIDSLLQEVGALQKDYFKIYEMLLELGYKDYDGDLINAKGQAEGVPIIPMEEMQKQVEEAVNKIAELNVNRKATFEFADLVLSTLRSQIGARELEALPGKRALQNEYFPSMDALWDENEPTA